MKYLNGEYYVEVKDHRHRIHSSENIILRRRNPATSLRTQYQVQNNTQIRKNQKIIKNDNGELVVEHYPKNKQLKSQKPKFKPRNCPTCKQTQWFEFEKRYYCRCCEYIINKQNHQIDKKNLRQDHYFSTRLNYANEKKTEF